MIDKRINERTVRFLLICLVEKPCGIVLLDYLITVSICAMIMIDLNKQNANVSKYTALFASFNLEQNVKFLTHFHGEILDHGITRYYKANSRFIRSLSINDCMSDHMCISITLDCFSSNYR